MKIKETFLTIDPPSGWKYGFPKAVTQEQYKQITDLKEWCIDNGYPKAEADSYGDYFHIQINGDLSFINKETSTKEQASKWFSSKSYLEQHSLSDKYFESKNPSLLTIEQVKEIWNREVNKECSKCKQTTENCECHIPYEVKHKDLIDFTKQLLGNSNQKQFKTFDESLFRAYIDKLPESESLNMIKIIYENKLPDCKFKAHLDKWFKL